MVLGLAVATLYCEICGNEITHFAKICPYCGSSQENGEEIKKNQAKKRFSSKVVNLEQGLPIAEVALHKMEQAISEGKRQNLTVLTFIHGYGSSGKGGVIRQECRKTLDYMRSRNVIKAYIFGEDFNKRSGSVRDLIRRYPELASDRNLGKSNKGITVVIL